MSSRFAVVASDPIGLDVVRVVVDAPRVARSALPGQFVIVRADVASERIPLTICEADREDGTLTLVVQVVGRSTADIANLTLGDHFADLLGPLGQPSRIGYHGVCAVVAGGVGAAIALPVARALCAVGNRVIGVVGARSADRLILLDDMVRTCSSVHIATEDGSAGTAGLVTDVLSQILAEEDVGWVFVVGPVPMMLAVADLTRLEAIPTVASLNPLMVDGTGLCGGCRVSIGGATRFACVDGPEFDAHAVDFELLARRNRTYEAFERCEAARAIGIHGISDG